MTHEHAKELLRGLAPDRTGAETDKAAARLARDTTASPAAGHRWYFAVTADDGPQVWRYGPLGNRYADKLGTIGAQNEHETRRDTNIVACTFSRAREVLGSHWPAEWPDTDPDAPPDHPGNATDMIPDNGQSRRTGMATEAKCPSITIPTCAACGQPKPTNAVLHTVDIAGGRFTYNPNGTIDFTPKPTDAVARFGAENDAHLRRVLREQTRRLTDAADTLRIEGPFPDCAERDMLVAVAKSVLRYAGGV